MAAHPKFYKVIDKAVFDYSMIEDGDKILIGASGGKDSTALVQYFALRQKRPESNFTFTALNIQSDFAPAFPSSIKKLFDNWNVDFKTLDVDILARVKSGQKMNCWWCSTQRRTELLNYAIANGYNKLVLGHHMDDILETLLMNMLSKSEVSTIIPRFKYKDYPVTVIRPLCYLCVDSIVEHAEKEGYMGFTCTCDYQENSARKEAREMLYALTKGQRVAKEHLFYSLKNIRTEFLP